MEVDPDFVFKSTGRVARHPRSSAKRRPYTTVAYPPFGRGKTSAGYQHVDPLVAINMPYVRRKDRRPAPTFRFGGRGRSLRRPFNPYYSCRMKRQFYRNKYVWSPYRIRRYRSRSRPRCRTCY